MIRVGSHTAKASNFVHPFVMKPTRLLPLSFLLFPSGLFAQHTIPKDIPLQGRVLSYEIFEVYNDHLNPTESSVEKGMYDKNGRILKITKGNMEWSSNVKIEKRIYTPSKEVIYECNCKDIESFIKEFVIRNRNELKNKPELLTAKSPTHRVTMNTLDKKGNVIHSALYSQRGYKTQDIWFEYTTANKVQTKTVYNMDSVRTLLEKNSYDRRGNLTEKIVKRGDTFVSKETLVYDKENNLIEKRHIEQDELLIHLEYAVKSLGTTKEFIITDRLQDTSYLDKIITYDVQNREIEQQQFLYSGKKPSIKRLEYYDDVKNVKSISRYNEEGKLHNKAEYDYDSHNNWTTARITQLVTVQEKGTTRQEMRKTKYVQKITY